MYDAFAILRIAHRVQAQTSCACTMHLGTSFLGRVQARYNKVISQVKHQRCSQTFGLAHDALARYIFIEANAHMSKLNRTCFLKMHRFQKHAHRTLKTEY